MFGSFGNIDVTIKLNITQIVYFCFTCCIVLHNIQQTCFLDKCDTFDMLLVAHLGIIVIVLTTWGNGSTDLVYDLRIWMRVFPLFLKIFKTKSISSSIGLWACFSIFWDDFLKAFSLKYTRFQDSVYLVSKVLSSFLLLSSTVFWKNIGLNARVLSSVAELRCEYLEQNSY